MILATGKLEARGELSEVVDDLTDADLVFEVTATPARTPTLDAEAYALIEAALQASIRPFAPGVASRLLKVAVLEEISKNSVSIWFNFHPTRSGSSIDFTNGTDPSLLKFAAQGVLTILSWMGGRSQLRLSDLHQAIRVLTWGTCATSSTRPTVSCPTTCPPSRSRKGSW